MKVKDIMSDVVVYVGPEDNLARVRNLFMRYGITKLPVIQDGALIGAVTELEVARAYASERGPIEEVRVSDVMTDKVQTVSPDDDVSGIIDVVVKSPLVVVSSGTEILGILGKLDLVRVLQSEISDRPVTSIMTPKPVSVRPEQSIFRAIKEMKENKVKHLPVISGGNLVGIVSAKDIALATFGLRPKRLTFSRRSSSGTRRVVRIVPQTVGGVMRSPVETIPAGASVKKAISRLINRGVGSVLVMERGKLEGIVTKTDVLMAVNK